MYEWFEPVTDGEYINAKRRTLKGHHVSRKSVASLVVKLATSPELEVRPSLGGKQIRIDRR